MGQILVSLATWLSSCGVKLIEERVDFIGEYDLIHVQQKHHWDCGVACLEMSVRWWRINRPDIGVVVLNAEEFEQKESPLWTIDIFLGLAQNGIDGAVMYTTCKGLRQLSLLRLFCTSQCRSIIDHVTRRLSSSLLTAGVHPSHYENSWYNDHLDADAQRVKEKFALASQLGLNINEVRLPEKLRNLDSRFGKRYSLRCISRKY
jgi:Guanylylate cyclase